MGIEDEVRKARLAREPKTKLEPDRPDRVKATQETLRKSGVLEDMENLRRMAGDPNARIEINDFGASLVWDEVAGGEYSGLGGFKQVSNKRTETPGQVGNDGRQVIHHKTETEYEVTTNKGYKVKSERRIDIFVGGDHVGICNTGIEGITRERLADKFVEVESSPPKEYPLEDDYLKGKRAKIVFTDRQTVIEKSVMEGDTSIAVTEEAKKKEERTRAEKRSRDSDRNTYKPY